jgi:ParB family transcriptional regulator, chromosome partitioning protein
VTTTEITVEQTENLPDALLPEPVNTTSDNSPQVEPPTNVKVDWVNPNTLIIGTNIRSNPDVPKWFVDDIEERGVRQPIPVRGEPDNYVVRTGQRRTLAACEAWARALAKGQQPRLVPVWVEPDLITDEATAEIDRIIDQLGENEHRLANSDADEARATQQLMDLGLSAGQIAKRRHIATKRVKTAVQVAKSTTAMDLLNKGLIEDITQAVVIADFGDDQDAVQQLTAVATTKPEQFDHIAQQLRDAREETRIRAELAAQLVEQGVTVIERPASLHDGPIRKLSDLRPTTESKSGTELTAEAHKDCPGHAAFVGNAGTWRPVAERWAIYYVCTDPKAHGHTDRYTLTLTSGRQSGPMTTEQKAERKKVVANNKAWRSAETVRLKWLKNFLHRKSAPKNAVAWVATMLAEGSHPMRKAMENDHELAIDLLGMPKPDVPSYYRRTAHPITTAIENATPARANVLLLALVVAALEKSVGTHTWKGATSEAKAYFRQLESWGYALSDVERLVIEPAAAPASVDEDVDEDDDLLYVEEEQEDTDGTEAETADVPDCDIGAELESEIEVLDAGDVAEVGGDPVGEYADLTGQPETGEYDADLAA